MKRLTSIWSLLLISMVLLVAPYDSFAQVSKRDLREYKQGPSFDLTHYYFFPQGNQQTAPLRALIWDLWTTRTKGFFNVTLYSREGAPTYCKFFVEPDSNGRWFVISECKHDDCPYSSKKRCRSYSKPIFTTKYDVVKRVTYGDAIFNSSGPRYRQVQIPDSEQRDPLTFRLILEVSTSDEEREF